MSNELLEWFKERKWSKTMKQLKKMIEVVQSCSIELHSSIVLAKNEKVEEALSSLKRLYQKENEADFLQRELFDSLREKENLLKPSVREDLMRIIRQIDFIADWIKVAGRNFELILELEISMPKKLTNNFVLMSEKLTEIVKPMKNVIILLSGDYEQIPSEIEKISKIEDEIDDLYFDTKKILALTDRKAGSIILFNDLLEGIENSADSCQENAAMIKILLYSR